MKVRYNSEYELIRKPKPRRPKTKTNRLVRRLALGIFYVIYLPFVLAATFTAMIVVDWLGINSGVVPAMLTMVTVVYALWRARLIRGLLPKIIWGVLIITVIGAIVFLLIDPVPKGDRTVSKKKLVMG